MNKQELKKKFLLLLKENKDLINKEDYDYYINMYNNQNPLLKTGPEYYYIPEGDVVIKSSVLYDFISAVIDETIKEMKEELF